jgi:Domain of unknown function (DUF4915)
MTTDHRVRIHASDHWWREPSAAEPRRFPIHANADFVQALERAGATLAVTSRQDSVLFLISISNGVCIASSIRVAAPMGISVNGDSLALGTAVSIRVHHDLTANDAAQATYIPVATHVTGGVSVHDVGWDAASSLWFVNTAFSALCVVDGRSHFRIAWRPDFITQDGPVDCCHLNGMAMTASGPQYATALAAAGTQEGWRAHGLDRGVLINLHHGIVLEDLSLPHSPQLRHDALWFLESGRGRLLRYAPTAAATNHASSEHALSEHALSEHALSNHPSSKAGSTDIVGEIPGVLRGLGFAADCAFIGLSKVRPTSGDAAEMLRQRFPDYSHCRIHAFDTLRGASCGYAELPGISEISSLCVLPKPSVRWLQPDAMQSATTFVYDE